MFVRRAPCSKRQKCEGYVSKDKQKNKFRKLSLYFIDRMEVIRFFQIQENEGIVSSVAFPFVLESRTSRFVAISIIQSSNDQRYLEDNNSISILGHTVALQNRIHMEGYRGGSRYVEGCWGFSYLKSFYGFWFYGFMVLWSQGVLV